MDDIGKVQKLIIPLAQCMPGMTVLQPVVDVETGNTIINKGQKLTEENIYRIKNFKHTEIWVDFNTEDKIWRVDKKKKYIYESYIKTLKLTLREVSKEGEIQLDEVIEIAKHMVRNFTCSFELLATVNHLKTVSSDVYEHSINVAFLSLLIGKWCGYNDKKIEQLVLAGLLHDIGKLHIPNYVFNNKNGLNVAERLQYKRHPIYGYEELSKYKELDIEVLKAVLSHHERCDGSGFPLGLTEERISDLSQIIGLIDEYDDLRRKYNMFKVIKILRVDKMHEFNTRILIEFCNNIMNYYIGTFVKLSTGEIGEVVMIQPNALHRPIIKVQSKCIDLYEHSDIQIIKIY